MGHLKSFVEDNIRLEILIVIWMLYLWELYLSRRQRKMVQSLEMPPASVAGIMSVEVYQKARDYSLHKNLLSHFSDLYNTLLTTVYISTLSYYYFWQWGNQVVQYFGITDESKIVTSAATMFIINIVTVIVALPLKIYYIFVLEEEFGFNKQTPGFFLKDQLKKFIVTQILILPVLCGIIWIVNNGGDYFFSYLLLFMNVVILFMIFLYPDVIAPLFDKYTALPEGELKTRIEALAASVGFPLYKLYIVEGSKRSAHSNAYLYGFHKNKRIVLYDTLIKGYCKSEKGDDKEEQGCEIEEIIGVLAHELGHWKYNHTFKMFILSQISICTNLLLFSLLLEYKPMYIAFGFTESQPVFIGLIIVSAYILTPVNTVLSFLSNVTTRRFEFQADGFGKKLGYAESLKRALIKLQKDNLSYPLFDKFYSTWHLSHPPLLERLATLDKAQ